MKPSKSSVDCVGLLKHFITKWSYYCSF